MDLIDKISDQIGRKIFSDLSPSIFKEVWNKIEDRVMDRVSSKSLYEVWPEFERDIVLRVISPIEISIKNKTYKFEFFLKKDLDKPIL